jgi:hypothetical protein
MTITVGIRIGMPTAIGISGAGPLARMSAA